MSSLKKLIGLDKVSNLVKIVQDNGGVVSSALKVFRMDDLKSGTLVGVDKYGNKYYENNAHFVGRNRWVEYADHYWLDYNASQIPAEWYGWMHYKTDLIPTKDPNRPHHRWMLDHTENMTATSEQYTPYSTTRPKIQAWVPPKK
ncbi:probable NADH dehydrogenase [ubiquinone] 1 alpha subcomplex subunit 12 [Nilaparvata lugens]|nr:probable NADH dehydrogenase [ubiquinone] 1 alpha subcomplex subunit 12 [Nilaparvata lugens]